jgi:hypothetical protein
MQPVTLYRALLRGYPAAFRDEYGEQMQGRRFREPPTYVSAF